MAVLLACGEWICFMLQKGTIYFNLCLFNIHTLVSHLSLPSFKKMGRAFLNVNEHPCGDGGSGGGGVCESVTGA